MWQMAGHGQPQKNGGKSITLNQYENRYKYATHVFEHAWDAFGTACGKYVFGVGDQKLRA